jgi:protein-S-isoprenylcysteine O-methyltransferase Ste14
MKWRLRFTRILLVPLGLLALTSHHVYPEGGMWDTSISVMGFLLLLAAMGGRIWASAYLVGRKNQTLVTAGPYSIVRNPLYFFSLIGFIGAGLAFESLVLAMLFGLVFFLSHWPVILKEEARLSELFGAEFEVYRRRVPRLIPRIRGLEGRRSMELDAHRFETALRDCIAIPLVFIAAHGLEAAKVSGILPVLFQLP